MSTDDRQLDRADEVTQDVVDRAVDGALEGEDWRALLKLARKDTDRFEKYIAALQARVSFSEPILMRLSDNLYIVCEGAGRVVKCGKCSHSYGDYRVNWKLAASIHVRETAESIEQVYRRGDFAPVEGWSEVREYSCPGCGTQLSVEVVPPGYPPIFEFLPDLDAFYRDWLGRPLDDQADGWFEDRTATAIGEWTAEEGPATARR